MKKTVLLFLSAITFSSIGVAGGDINLEPVAEPKVVESIEGWNFHFAPLFLWAMDTDGANTIGPVSVPLDVPFSDALENLDIAFTFHFEANKGDWTLFTEYQYVKLEPSADLPLGGSMGVDFKNYMFELGGAYTFSRSERSQWQGIGGLRYTKQKVKVTVTPALPTLPVLTPLNVSEDWTDFFVGLRNIYKITDKWSLLSRADIGAGGSDLVWNASMIADYRFNEWGSAFIGYKVMDYDYDNGERGLNTYAYDATLQGPVLGLNIHW
ncbi:hypothetical protein ACLHDG_02385 [Sulfurovum sp. CS9]|uniref:hypothetical protein n=1 Tax=Sulfurovum sp. CS9 TaxID=3391146 RepID=UPI0039E8C59E